MNNQKPFKVKANVYVDRLGSVLLRPICDSGECELQALKLLEGEILDITIEMDDEDS